MRFLPSIAPLLLMVFVVASPRLAVAAPSRIVGTDLLGPEFSKALYAAAARAGVQVLVTFDGSRPGAAALKQGKADMALLSLPEAELADLSEFRLTPVAYHRVVVLVPETCPLRKITLAQLATIFGARGTGSMGWGDLPGAMEWAGNAIVAVAPEMGSGVTLDFFRHVVLGGGELKHNLVRYRTTAELLGHFTSESRVIALAAALPKEAARMRVLAVGEREGDAVLPEPQAVHAGKYPLRLPLFVAVRSEAAMQLEGLQNWLRGDEAAAQFERAGLQARPPDTRNEEVRK